MERFIPVRPGIDIGYGFNTLNGEVRGVAVQGDITPATTSGQVVTSDAKVVESSDQMMESLNVSVEASGHYGLFSAEGRFGLAQQSSYTAQSTYVVAKCVVENAFRSFARPSILPEAAQRLRDDGPDAFKKGYGDAFVRGMRSGGEFYAVFQLTSTSSETQKSIAVSLQAEVQGLLAGGSVETSIEHMSKNSQKTSSMSMLFYQRAGRDNTIAPVSKPDEILSRLKEFPAIANAAPVGYLAQMVDYQVLALPNFDEVGFQQRAEALEDYARLKMKYLGIRSEIELVRNNPDVFVSDYTDAELSKGFDLYTRTVNMLNRHARKVANKEIEPMLFDASAYDSELRELPMFIFKKKAPSADIVQVPNVLGLAVDAAKGLIASMGLSASSNPTAVAQAAGVPLNVVTKQTPAYGDSVPKGSAVVIDYNYVASDRFGWLLRQKINDQRISAFRVLTR